MANFFIIGGSSGIGKTLAENLSAAAFLLSEKSSWITGQILHVDGGISNLKL